MGLYTLLKVKIRADPEPVFDQSAILVFSQFVSFDVGVGIDPNPLSPNGLYCQFVVDLPIEGDTSTFEHKVIQFRSTTKVVVSVHSDFANIKKTDPR